VGVDVTQWTRAYNGELVGPTIRVKPGQTLKIRLHNRLAPERCATRSVENNVHQINTTSLHTHGLHISGESPADDALSPVEPGATREYVYQLPVDHMGGTFWYHPHVHGSGSEQAGGGAFGMLIVEDDVEAMRLPSEVARLEEIPMVLTHLDMPFQAKLAGYYTRNCNRQTDAHGNPLCTEAECDDPIWGHAPRRGEARGDLVLVNGMTMPTIRMVAGRWYRWRLLLGSGGGPDFMPHAKNCEVSLLAKDGYVLSRAPRPIERGFMAGGNRADWLVRCPAGVHRFAADVRVVRSMEDIHSDVSGEAVWQLATIEAVVDEKGEEPTVEIPPFETRRPCYLADLTNVEPSRELEFDMRSMWQINGKRWGGEEALEYPPLEVGDVVDLAVYGLGYHDYVAHIFHIHVNPFQLVDEPPDTYGGYFQKGDWHDTLKGPYTWDKSFKFRLRTQLDRFTGHVIVHCHYLWHQDLGMMTMLRVDGAEGTRAARGAAADPTCYIKEPLLAEALALPAGAPRSIDEEHERGGASASGPRTPGVALLLLGLLLATTMTATAARQDYRRARRDGTHLF
jgi:FtsP/CotA-like multicopper oxidase with cupredoxin domain